MRPVITTKVGMQSIMYAPEGSEAIIKDVYENGEYDCFLDGHSLKILDIGANVGAFSLWAMRRFPGSTIQAFEPVKEVFDCLKKNIEFYPFIAAHNLAVSTESSFTMKVNKDRFYMSGTITNHAASDDVEERVVQTIHPRDLPEADIVKVDTEGAEADILTNMRLEKTTAVIVEVHSPELLEAVEGHLRKNEFYLWCALRYLRVGVGELIYVNRNHQNTNIRSLYLDENEYKASLK